MGRKYGFSLREICVFGGPGDRPGHPGRGAETFGDQLWASVRTPKALARQLRSTLDAKMWPEGIFSSTVGSGKVIRVVVFDTKVMISCFELHCVSKNVFTSEAMGVPRLFFRGRRQWSQASQSADPRSGGRGGLGILSLTDII